MRCSTFLSQAKGSTLLSFAVAMREQTVAHRTPPPSEPANKWFRMARSTGLLSSSISDGLGEGAGGWNAAKLPLEPGLHHLDEWPGTGVADMPTCVGCAALDRPLDRIEFGDPPQGLGGDR